MLAGIVALAAGHTSVAYSCCRWLALVCLLLVFVHWPCLSDLFCLDQSPCCCVMLVTCRSCLGWPLCCTALALTSAFVHPLSVPKVYLVVMLYWPLSCHVLYFMLPFAPHRLRLLLSPCPVVPSTSQCPLHHFDHTIFFALSLASPSCTVYFMPPSATQKPCPLLCATTHLTFAPSTSCHPLPYIDCALCSMLPLAGLNCNICFVRPSLMLVVPSTPLITCNWCIINGF